VGKKPPQSQKGRSHGLTPQKSTGLSLKEEKTKTNKLKNKIKIFFIFGRRQPCKAPPGRLRPGGKPKKLFIYFILFIYFWLQATLWELRGSSVPRRKTKFYFIYFNF
jgi:hypothetical protein